MKDCTLLFSFSHPYHFHLKYLSAQFHIVPIAPGRTQVLLRQNLPKGPILSTLISVPFAEPFLEKLINIWNYHIALEGMLCLLIRVPLFIGQLKLWLFRY